MRIGGLPVVDAAKGETLHVIDKDVKMGKTKDPALCAFARACMRDLNATEVRVHLSRTYVKEEKKWIRYNTSSAMRDEIISFDRGGKFIPGEYKLLPHIHSDKRIIPRPKKGKLRLIKKPHVRIIAGVRSHGANR